MVPVISILLDILGRANLTDRGIALFCVLGILIFLFLLYKLPSRILFSLALFLLICIPVSILFRNKELAYKLAIWNYLILVSALIVAAIEGYNFGKYFQPILKLLKRLKE